MASPIGDMVVAIVGDTTQFDTAIKKTETSFKKFGDDMIKTGKSLSLYVTAPIVAMGTMMVKSAGESAAALAGLENAIKATGKQGQISVESLNALAGQLQKVTLFEDDASIAALTLVQQLAGLDEEGLKKVLPAMQNFAQATGTDLQSAASLFGKTLGSSTNALARSGIEIDATASKSEKLAQIIAQMDKKFAGAAQTAAMAGTGPLMVLKNQIGDLGEEMGMILIPAINGIVAEVRKLVDWMASLSDEQKKTILTIAGLAAGLGPLLIGLGKTITAIDTVKKAIGTLGVASGPIGITIAAIGALVAGLAAIDGWVKQRQVEAAKEEFAGLAAEVKAAGGNVDAFAKNAIVVKEKLLGMSDSFRSMSTAVGGSRDIWSALFPIVGVVKDIDAASKGWKESQKNIFDIIDETAEATGESKETLIEIGLADKTITEEVRNQLQTYKEILGLQRGEAADKARWAAIEAAARKEATTASEESLKAWKEKLELIRSINEEGVSEIDKLDAEIASLRAFSSKYVDIMAERDKAIAALVERRMVLTANDSVEELRDEQEYRREQVIAATDASEAIVDDLNELHRERMDLLEIDVAATRAAEQSKREEAQKTMAQTLSITQDVIGQLSSLYTMYSKNQMDALDSETEKRISDAERVLKESDAYKNASVEEQERMAKELADNEVAIRKEAEKKKYALELANFKTGQAFAIAQATINGAGAVIKALNDLGPVLGPIMAAVNAGLVATQIALIAGQTPPSPPAFAEGGIVMPSQGGTLARVAEAGQPEIIFPLDQLERFLGSSASDGGMMHVTVQLDSKPIMDKIFPATKNRQVLISAGAVV